MLECWNIGMLGKNRKEILTIIPTFHHSVIPVGNVGR
jgi:hypothetical protein